MHIVIYEALYLDVAQVRMNEAPNETRTHSCRPASHYTTKSAQLIYAYIFPCERIHWL